MFGFRVLPENRFKEELVGKEGPEDSMRARFTILFQADGRNRVALDCEVASCGPRHKGPAVDTIAEAIQALFVTFSACVVPVLIEPGSVEIFATKRDGSRRWCWRLLQAKPPVHTLEDLLEAVGHEDEILHPRLAQLPEDGHHEEEPADAEQRVLTGVA